MIHYLHDLHPADAPAPNEDAPGGEVGEPLDDDDEFVAGEVGDEEDDNQQTQVGVCPHRVHVVVSLNGNRNSTYILNFTQKEYQNIVTKMSPFKIVLLEEIALFLLNSLPAQV